ncbi:DNA-binding protein RFX8 isoform X3 [Manacus candei]|uniref:DNA-binding protein RFX8 isoform X3 n=1 Tax=Manacus candei TaxID=415023 RepID=UPI002227EF9C|nr:DNA-binding protein RFX8 isoform X3 [Manacus candei]
MPGMLAVAPRAALPGGCAELPCCRRGGRGAGAGVARAGRYRRPLPAGPAGPAPMADTPPQPAPEPAEMAYCGPTSLTYLPVLQWLADNFYLCGGCTVPCRLLHELYIETCNPDFKIQVHPSTFGKLIQLVFPGLVTRKRTTAGSIRYHYDGIAIKKNSSFYARFCCLLYEQNYLRHCSPGEVSISDVQPSTSAGTSNNSWSSENADDYKKNRQKKGTSKNLEYYPSVIYLKAEKETFQYLFPEFNQFFLGEQVQSETDPYEMIALLANDYYNYCQVILQMVRENKLDKVEDCIMSFWRSLQPERIELMCLPDVCQLLKSYDRYLFKTVRALLNNNSTVTVLRSGLHAVFNEQSLAVTKNLFREKFRNPKKRQKNIQFKCLKNLISLLTSSTDIRDLLSCFSSDLQTFVIKPSRSKETFKKQASDFMLKWNLLLSTVGKILTINRTDSFGSWLLLNLLLVDFAAHVFQTYIEEEKEDGNSLVAKQNEVPVLCVYEPNHLSACFAEDQPQANAPQTALVMQNQNNFGLSNIFQSSELFGEHSHCQQAHPSNFGREIYYNVY